MMRLRAALLLLICCTSCSRRVATASHPQPATRDARDLGVAISRDTVHFVVLGDFGSADAAEAAVSSAVETVAAKAKFDFGITVGDNFYPRGVASADDPLWKRAFDAPFGSLGFKYFATLGNHDYLGDPDSEITRTKPGGSWQMPFYYYTFRAGPVRFYALDTALDDKGTRAPPTGTAADVWRTELAWLKAELARPRDTRWRIAYGHRPIYSTGFHGDTPFLQSTLLPVLKAGGLDVFLAGHDHTLEYLRDDSNIAYFISGGGGGQTGGFRRRRSRTSARPGSEFFYRGHGFIDFTVDGSKASVTLFDSFAAVLKTITLPEAPSR